MVLIVVDDLLALLFVKYHCPRCNREEWRPVTPEDLSGCLFGEKETTAAQSPSAPRGAIQVDEIIDFHEALENLTLADLAELAETA